MSYNRSYMIHCEDCCRPATYQVQNAPWNVQNTTLKLFNTNAALGNSPASMSASTANTIDLGGGVGCTTCTVTGYDMSITYTEQSGGTSSCTALPNYRVSCYPSCDEDPCTSFDPCAGETQEAYTVCFDESTISNCCTPSPPVSGECAQIYTYTVGVANEIQETEYYDSGLKLLGTPENFVGFPTVYEGCNAYKKGLRNIYAKKDPSWNYISLKWFVAKEWDESTENIMYIKDLPVLQNKFTDYATSITLNEDIGITCSGSGLELFQKLRLGDGEGDGSFGEGSGWYDITDTEVEFTYMKPNTKAGSAWIGFDYACGCSGGLYCCEDYCGCGYNDTTFLGAYSRILYSSDVEDEGGTCIWDASPDGVNFGGSWTASDSHGAFSSGSYSI